ncbi:MAG: ABC transporter permease [Chloroflexi bacterium]|nr:MAG: ABC transporter permease [Chloroflexota bacterium]
MRNFIARRLLYAVPTLIGISIITFAIARLSPGDPIRLFTFGIQDFTQDDYNRLLHAYGLDKPLPFQYVDWITNALRGKFGDSLIYHRDAFVMLLERLPNTLQLASAALLLQLVIGVPLGVIAALRRGSWVDGLIRVFGVAGHAIPAFWLGLVLIIIFATAGSFGPKRWTCSRRTSSGPPTRKVSASGPWCSCTRSATP